MKFNKYNVSPKESRTVDNIVFDSKKEMNRYLELKLLLKSNLIKNLIIHPKFPLLPKFTKMGKNYRGMEYEADFSYIEVATGKKILEDTKGFQTAEFKLKKKLFDYIYPELELTIL